MEKKLAIAVWFNLLLYGSQHPTRAVEITYINDDGSEHSVSFKDTDEKVQRIHTDGKVDDEMLQ